MRNSECIEITATAMCRESKYRRLVVLLCNVLPSRHWAGTDNGPVTSQPAYCCSSCIGGKSPISQSIVLWTQLIILITSLWFL